MSVSNAPHPNPAARILAYDALSARGPYRRPHATYSSCTALPPRYPQAPAARAPAHPAISTVATPSPHSFSPAPLTHQRQLVAICSTGRTAARALQPPPDSPAYEPAGHALHVCHPGPAEKEPARHGSQGGRPCRCRGNQLFRGSPTAQKGAYIHTYIHRQTDKCTPAHTTLVVKQRVACSTSRRTRMILTTGDARARACIDTDTRTQTRLRHACPPARARQIPFDTQLPSPRRLCRRARTQVTGVCP